MTGPRVIDAHVHIDLAFVGQQLGQIAGLVVQPEYADAALAEKGIAVLPDVLANAGGVTVSYYEWIQGRTGERWTEETVGERLKARFDRIAPQVFDRAEAEDTPLREAAYAIAVERIAAAIESRGDSCYFKN